MAKCSHHMHEYEGVWACNVEDLSSVARGCGFWTGGYVKGNMFEVIVVSGSLILAHIFHLHVRLCAARHAVCQRSLACVCGPCVGSFVHGAHDGAHDGVDVVGESHGRGQLAESGEEDIAGASCLWPPVRGLHLRDNVLLNIVTSIWTSEAALAHSDGSIHTF